MYVWRKPVCNRSFSKRYGHRIASHLAVGKSDGCVQSGCSDRNTAKAIRTKSDY